MRALWLLGLVGCAATPLAPVAVAPPPPAAAAPVASALPKPPGLRIGDAVKPTRYVVTLDLDPTATTFAGVIDTELELARPSSLVWMHASDLEIAKATLGGQPARVVAGDDDYVGFAVDAPIPAGKAAFYAEYTGRVQDHEVRGVFVEKDNDQPYLFTQFENIDARRAFPCFDEPSFKVPWQLSLRVRAGDLAISNTPVESETAEKDGRKLVRFAETPPMPSYLVAFVVGPFEVIDAGKKVRIVVPRGLTKEAAFAVKNSPVILERLEKYFGVPYPYAKLDIVAVPQLVSFAAMENAGLVTFSKQLLLAKAQDVTPAFERRCISILVHEMAHQWFGNLVTMAWWDDVWLNEAFASWMEGKILVAWKPQWTWETVTAGEAAWARMGDSLLSARTIRQPIGSKHDIDNAFDDITYLKGQSVVAMFEAWVGEEKFAKGVARYLGTHAWKNATSADFMAAISAEAGRDVAPAFSTFLDQSGVPLVTAKMDCSSGAARLTLAQDRYLPAGSPGDSPRRWQIPICARHPGGRTCTLVDGPSATIELPGKCPPWAVPNAGGAGYYTVAYSGDELRRLLQLGKALTLAERLTLIYDAGAMVRAGKLGIGEVLGEVTALMKDPSVHVQIAAVQMVTALKDSQIPPELAPQFSRFVKSAFGPRARELGYRSKKGETDETRLLRPQLLLLAADRGEDTQLVAMAVKLAHAWLKSPDAIEDDMVDAVLTIAAHASGPRMSTPQQPSAASQGAALFDRFHEDAKATTDDRRREHLLDAMASFRDPAVVQASLAIFLTDEFDSRESIALLVQDPRMQDIVFAFVRENYAPLLTRIPADGRSELPRVGEPFCDEEHLTAVRAYFEPLVDALGGPRPLAQTLETIRLCSALRDAQAASLKTFLGRM